MSYITDNPWPLIILLSGAAIVCFMAIPGKGRSFGLGCLLAAVGIYIIEDQIVSPSERVEMEIHSMLDAFKANDIDAIDMQISDQSPELVNVASQGLDLIEFGEAFHVKSVEVEFPDDSHAVAKVRANGWITSRNSNMTQRVAEYWETSWQHEAGVWQMTDATRLNPITGERIGYFDSQ